MTESERRFEYWCALRGYRFERIVLPTNPNWRSNFGYGSGRQLTEDDRVEPSAVCVMDRRELRPSIYHNPFAAQPLFPRYVSESGDQHFSKDGHPENQGTSGWNMLVNAND